MKDILAIYDLQKQITRAADQLVISITAMLVKGPTEETIVEAIKLAKLIDLAQTQITDMLNHVLNGAAHPSEKVTDKEGAL